MLVLVGVGSVPNLPRLFGTNQKWYIFTLVTRSPKTPYFDMNQKWHIFTFVAHIINTIYLLKTKHLFKIPTVVVYQKRTICPMSVYVYVYVYVCMLMCTCVCTN